MDTSPTTQQAEPDWLDRAEETWAKIRTLGVVKAPDVLAVSLARSSSSIRIVLSPDADSSLAAVRLGLGNHLATTLDNGSIHHDWSRVIDGVDVHVVTVIREREAVAS